MRPLPLAVMVATCVFASIAAVPTLFAQFAPGEGGGAFGWPPHITRLSPTEDYLIGFFSWDGTGGRILWGESPGDPTSGGPGPASNAPGGFGIQSWLGWNLKSNTGGRQGAESLRIIEFRGEPLAQDIYLNASRPIQLRLPFTSPRTVPVHVVGSGCDSFDVELYAGTHFLAGAVSVFVQNPSYSPCEILASLHPELDELKAGDTLTLRLIQVAKPDDTAPTFHFGATSTLELPRFSPAEALQRWSGDALDRAGGGSGPLGPGATLVAFPLAAALRRIRGISLTILLLFLSGCTGPSASLGAPDDPAVAAPTASQSYLEDFGGLAANGTAAFLAIVSDPFNRYVAGATVTIEGTPFYNRTDAHGRTLFDGVLPGDYRVRIDHAEFVTAELPVVLVAGRTLQTEVRLEFRESGLGDLPPHRHTQYWPASGEKTLFEGDVALEPTTSQNPGPTTFCSNRWPAYFGSDICFVSFRLPERPTDPYLVYPGTRWVEVRISWSNVSETALQTERAGIAFRSLDPLSSANLTWMYPRNDGQGTRIATTWEMADDAHQPISLWEWMLYFPISPSQNYVYEPHPSLAIWAMPRQVHVEIKVVRGVVPLDPPHPNFWSASNQRVVINNTLRNSFNPAWVPAGELVPPGTEWLELDLRKDPRSKWGYALHYRTADMPVDACSNDIACKVRVYKHAAKGSEEGRYLSFEIRLEEYETDPHYAKQSRFAFVVEHLQPCPASPVEGGGTANAASSLLGDAVGCPFAPTRYPLELHVVAHRD